jgi:GNAT superfamily N-acetyltransferase
VLLVKSLSTDDLSTPEWTLAFPVLKELRPALTESSLRQIVEDGSCEGLRFLAAFEGSETATQACVGVAGWRVMTCTTAGRKAHVDDLVTCAAARGRGVGAMLLAEVTRRASDAGCTTLELDSGVQRFDAHRFYLRERMKIAAHHFALALPG